MDDAGLAQRSALAGVFALALARAPTDAMRVWARGFFDDLCRAKLVLPHAVGDGLAPLLLDGVVSDADAAVGPNPFAEGVAGDAAGRAGALPGWGG